MTKTAKLIYSFDKMSKAVQTPLTSIRGIVFDVSCFLRMYKRKRHHGINSSFLKMDGTMTMPGSIDFGLMRKRLGITLNDDILGHVESLVGPVKDQAEAIICEMEAEALENTIVQPGLASLFEHLELTGLRRGIITRNNRASLNHFLDLVPHTFDADCVLDRSFLPPKPSSRPLQHILDKWQLHPSAVLMVGDSIDDIECGRSAGSYTVLVKNIENAHLAPHADFVVECLSEIKLLFSNDSIPVNVK